MLPGSMLMTNFDSDWKTRNRPMPAPPDASLNCSGPLTRHRFRYVTTVSCVSDPNGSISATAM